MHALQQVGYNCEDDDLAALADTVLSVTKMRWTNDDTRLQSHFWNKMTDDTKQSWARTPHDLKKL